MTKILFLFCCMYALAELDSNLLINTIINYFIESKRELFISEKIMFVLYWTCMC